MTTVAHGPQPPPLRRRLVRRLLPRLLLRRWQIRRTEAAIDAFTPRIVSHRYHGVSLTVRITDPLSARWYDQDWPSAVLPELELLRETSLRPGAVVFDIGAHQGIVSLIMGALVGEDGLVVSVEASAHNAGAALQNVVLNRMRQVVPLFAAVGEEPGTLLFDRLGAEVATGRAGADRVPCMTVDQLTDTYGVPDLLWIDVEGFECQVLRGAERTLGHGSDVCVEIHLRTLLDRHEGSVAEALSHFAEGYELFVNTSPNDRVHKMEPLNPSSLPTGRFSLVARRPRQVRSG